MTEILNSFRVEEDGTVTFEIPNEIPQSDNEAVCLNIDLYAEFQQGDFDNKKNLVLFYDYEKLSVFLQISLDEAVVSQSVCAEIT